MPRRITHVLNDLTMQRVTPEVNSTSVSEQRMIGEGMGDLLHTLSESDGGFYWCVFPI